MFIQAIILFVLFPSYMIWFLVDTGFIRDVDTRKVTKVTFNRLIIVIVTFTAITLLVIALAFLGVTEPFKMWFKTE